ncbi:MAG: dienelactone hydrolase family protein [Acidimicrobiia bacterium]|jgi:carboxymethylenebutenolidase
MNDATPALPVPYFLARPAPATARPGAGVVVIQEGNGISPQLLRVCERLAREGYLVAAPDLFHQLGGPDPARAGEQYPALRSEDALTDIAEVVAQLRDLGAERIGVTGFCMGGRLTYETATSGIDVQCAVAFYGSGIGGRLAALTCPTLLLYGGTDEYVPMREIETVRAHHPDDVVVYADAGHGFFRDGSDSYEEAAATDAWHRLTGLFAAHLV